MFINNATIKKMVHASVLMLTTATAAAFSFNMSYVEVNSNALSNVGCYIRSDNQQPYFGVTSIFAANVNGTDPNAPVIYYNDNIQALLQTSQVKDLQKQGIKVLMTLLGNHENAGWSCMTDPVAAQNFANQIVDMVNTYQLDGVDIDDEYSTCETNDSSLIMLAQAIKTNPAFQGKLLTKALLDDAQYFASTYQGHHLAEYLDYGWEMSYGSDQFAERLAVYLQNGMTPDRLMIGGWTAYTFPDPFSIGQYTTQNSLAGAMVYDVTNSSQSYINQVFQGEDGSAASIDVIPGCLQ